MYLDVLIRTQTTTTPSATSDDGSCTYDVTFTVDMNCSGLNVGSVFATGPSDGWSCGSYALTDSDGDGIWEGTFNLQQVLLSIYIVLMDGRIVKRLIYWHTEQVLEIGHVLL